MVIYVIVCNETLKIYVGQHKWDDRLQKYLAQKWSRAHLDAGDRSYLYNAFRKHPRESWSIHPLVSGIETRAELDEMEKHFIQVLKAQHPDVGYNICRGGEGFSGSHTKEAKQKLGVISRERWANRSPEERLSWRQNMSKGWLKNYAVSRAIRAARAAQRDRIGSPACREKISAIMKQACAEGRIHPHKFTPEELEKAHQAAAKALTGVRRPPEAIAGMHSPAARAKALVSLRATVKGKPKSAAVRARMSEGKRREWATRPRK